MEEEDQEWDQLLCTSISCLSEILVSICYTYYLHCLSISACKVTTANIDLAALPCHAIFAARQDGPFPLILGVGLFGP